MKNTLDTLADPSRREITTVFLTDIRVNEGTYNAGTVRVALTTSHSKTRKRFETDLHREVLTDSGFVTRSFTLFSRTPNADAGITLASQPTTRFNATKARDLHEYVLTNLTHLLHVTEGEVAIQLRDLLCREVEAA